MGLCRAVVCVVALLTIVVPARADDVRSTARRDALALARRAQTLYDAQRFDAAAALLEQAYELFPEPVLLYNLGRTREMAGDTQGAIVVYRHFVERSSASDPRYAAANARLARLESSPPAPSPEEPRGAPSPEPRQAAPTAPVTRSVEATTDSVALTPAPRKPLYRRWWLWTTVGLVAAVGLGVGLGLGLTRAHNNFDPTISDIHAQ